jgi:formamidopyrimidine-DNA glycosylase
MPELPDVATFARYLNATSLHQEIDDVEVREPRLLKDLDPAGIERGLRGRRLAATRRHGKYVFVPFEADGDGALVLHFGMTGFPSYYRRDDREPDYARLLVRFAGGGTLAVVSRRLLGEVRLTDDPDAFVAAQELGPDALHDVTDVGALQEALAGRRGMVKPTLMNQSVLAGIGNVYADEILYQTGLDPRTPVDELSGEEMRALLRTMRRVLTTAIDRGADAQAYPRRWLTPRREPGRACPRCDGTIQRIEVSGRAGYWCPNGQGRGDRG